LNSLVRRTPEKIHTQSTVTEIVSGDEGKRHQIHVTSPEEMKVYESRFLFLQQDAMKVQEEIDLFLVLDLPGSLLQEPSKKWSTFSG
jgi:hypothetical protein